MKFEKIKPGMVLYDRHKYKMGNTHMRSIGEWPVRIIEVNSENRKALVSWNGNAPTWYWESQLSALKDWSMNDACAEVTRSATLGAVYRVRKLSKAEMAAKEKP